MNITREIFHQLAGVLIWPVILSLLGLLAWTVVTVGVFGREWLERRRGIYRGRETANRRLDAIACEEPGYDLCLERVLQETEHARWRVLNRGRLPVRVGPSLGLMGTLIPMAAALSALASGNLPSLASNMVTAFAATVIGLAISIVAYLISSAREEWVRADTRELAFHAELLLRNQKVAAHAFR